MAKRKATKKQLMALAKGRAKLKLKRKTVRRVVRTTKTKSPSKMAKKRRVTRKKQAPSMLKGFSGILGAVAYGAVRERASNYINNSKFGRSLPVTQFTDEAVMLGINYGARKLGLGKNPIGNSILRAQKTVELARIGQGINDLYSQKQAQKNGALATGNGQVIVLQN